MEEAKEAIVSKKKEAKEANNKGQDVKSSSSLLLYGAASATAAVAATAAIQFIMPKDPTFHVISVRLSSFLGHDFDVTQSFKLHHPLIDAELILTVQVTNPNVVPIVYSSSLMSIFYDGSLLGTAQVEADSQPAKSSRMLKLPAKLDGVELVSNHLRKFLGDVARREMKLDAVVDIEGTAKVMWWGHRFKIHVDSHMVVDPVYLDVIDQENKSALELFVRSTSGKEEGEPEPGKVD